jgi:hypothetical protein
MLALSTDVKLIKIQEKARILDKDILNRIKLTFKSQGYQDSKQILIPESTINLNTKSTSLRSHTVGGNLIGKSLKLPKNLFVVGTINLDETTKSISPKVVDRANLIEFNDLDDFLFIKDDNKYDLEFLKMMNVDISSSEYLDIRKTVLDLKDREALPAKLKLSEDSETLLQDLYSFLKVFKLHFSYRTLKEIIIFVNI